MSPRDTLAAELREAYVTAKHNTLADHYLPGCEGCNPWPKLAAVAERKIVEAQREAWVSAAGEKQRREAEQRYPLPGEDGPARQGKIEPVVPERWENSTRLETKINEIIDAVNALREAR